jgi:hypothetical protein
LLGFYASNFEKTPDGIIRGGASLYTIEMRIRGGNARVYSSASGTLRFQSAIAPVRGAMAGARADNEASYDLLRIGDSWAYEPYEAFEVLLPDGTTEQYGRIPRNGVEWDDGLGVFSLASDVEEYTTRPGVGISMDYDFYHSKAMPIPNNAYYTAAVRLLDINVWYSRMFFGDSDGFGIIWYSDVDSLVYWANQGAYRWHLRGFALWALGQEDMRLWEALPKMIP